MLELNGIQINVIAVIAATIVSFLLSFAWYGAVFAKPWMAQMGYDPNMRPEGKAMIKGVSLLIIGSFLTAWVLAFYLSGWKYIPNSADAPPIAFAINSALSVFIGFLLPMQLARVVWERHSWKLFFINAGHNLTSVIVVALIIALWP